MSRQIMRKPYIKVSGKGRNEITSPHKAEKFSAAIQAKSPLKPNQCTAEIDEAKAVEKSAENTSSSESGSGDESGMSSIDKGKHNIAPDEENVFQIKVIEKQEKRSSSESDFGGKY